MSWPTDSSTLEEEEEKEEQDPEPLITDVEPKQGEENEEETRQTDQEDQQEPNRQRHLQDLEVVMGEEERLAYDDPWSDSNATVMGLMATPRGV